MADTAKIWFFHDGNAKAGPFSLDDLQAKYDRGEIAPNHYLWREGMANWKKVAELNVFRPAPVAEVAPPEFQPEPEEAGYGNAGGEPDGSVEMQPVLMTAVGARAAPDPRYHESTTAASASAATHIPRGALAHAATPQAAAGYRAAYQGGAEAVARVSEASMQAEEEIQTRVMTPSQTNLQAPSRVEDGLSALIEIPSKDVVDNTGQLDIGQLRNARKEAERATQVAKVTQKAAPLPHFGDIPAGGGMSFTKRLVICLGLIAASGSLLYFVMPDYFNSGVALIHKLFSPIPSLADVSPDEYAMLVSAASGKPGESAKASMALSLTNSETPSFYIATNLSPGTPLTLTLEPVQGTLVGELLGSLQVSLTVADKLGKTSPIRTKDGASLPMGDYMVRLLDKDNHLMASRQYFLGGIKDAGYQAKLAEYLRGRRAMAQNEVDRARTLLTKVEGLVEFERRAVPPIARLSQPVARTKAWSQYDAQWAARVAEIDRDSQLDPKIFIYLSQSAVATASEAKQLHDTYRSQLDASAPPATVLGVLKGTDSLVNQSLTNLNRSFLEVKARIDLAAKSINSGGFIKE